jgi:hypothetical protein
LVPRGSNRFTPLTTYADETPAGLSMLSTPCKFIAFPPLLLPLLLPLLPPPPPPEGGRTF